MDTSTTLLWLTFLLTVIQVVLALFSGIVGLLQLQCSLRELQQDDRSIIPPTQIQLNK